MVEKEEEIDWSKMTFQGVALEQLLAGAELTPDERFIWLCEMNEELKDFLPKR